MANELKGEPALSCRRVMIAFGIVFMISRVIGLVKAVESRQKSYYYYYHYYYYNCYHYYYYY